MSLLTLNSVSKSFNGLKAVDAISFSVDRGQVVGFLGPNGAGKSTTMRMITQYFEPDEGEILFDGVPLGAAGREAKRRIGYLAENNPLYGDVLVAEYLRFAATLRELHGREQKEAIDRAVAATSIEDVFYRPISQLSKGFRQRVGLAQAILHQPDLLILDEPTEGLDPNQRVEIRLLISALGKDRTVILSTHVLPEVQQTCSRLLIIHRGRIVADGTVEELMTRAEGSAEIQVEASGEKVLERLRELKGVVGVTRRSEAGGRVSVTLAVEDGEDLRPQIFELAKRSGWTLYELHQEKGNLEALFRQLTAGESGE